MKLDKQEELLKRSITGDLSAFEYLVIATSGNLSKQRDQIAPQILTTATLLRILHGLKDNAFTSVSVQKWASFMRRGYLSTSSAPVRPIDVEFQLDAEELISDVLSRLDDLGDSVDGVISDDELDCMIALLEAKGSGGSGTPDL